MPHGLVAPPDVGHGHVRFFFFFLNLIYVVGAEFFFHFVVFKLRAAIRPKRAWVPRFYEYVRSIPLTTLCPSKGL